MFHFAMDSCQRRVFSSCSYFEMANDCVVVLLLF